LRWPKKSGGERIISAPRAKLKRAQHFVLKHVLAQFPLSPVAHGFAPGRSIVSNASPHVGAAVVINVDLKDFFPSISYRRVKGLYRTIGYSEEVATVLALLCTEADTVHSVLDGVTYYVAQGPRKLPQGAPTSPAISNALCRRLDARLVGWAAKNGFVFTRYADDLTLSCQSRDADVGSALAVIRRLATAEGFTVHPDKIRVVRAARRQEVTGVVVNHKPSVPRDQLRRFRAFLYHVGKDGAQGKHWNGAGAIGGATPESSMRILQSALGFASYVAMVDPDKGRPLLARVSELMAKQRR
jgi:RNA-directed DNA polymerase